MKEEDFDTFFELLPRVAALPADHSGRRAFAREYGQETFLLMAWLTKLGIMGGETAMHPAPPNKCDVCHGDLSRQAFFIDGQSTDGSWGYFCFSGFARQGEGIGWGLGQLYHAVRPGEWRMIAGGDPS